MKALLKMRSIAQFVLLCPLNRSRRVSDPFVVSGFSPLIATRNNFRSGRQSSIGQLWDREMITHGENSISENRIGKTKNKWLVVGDGDLSYSATIAEDLAEKNIQLFATVLEEENVHNAVYRRSSQNTAAILSYRKRNCDGTILDNTKNVTTTSTTIISQHQVRFGIDATRLDFFFYLEKFQTIQFNFPHWGGKTNARRNRELIDCFVASASKVLHNEGEIIISLCEGQGGFPASTIDEWKQSWLVPEFAANHGLVLRNLMPYEPSYQQTSHRGKDRPWIKDGTAQQYTFSFPNQKSIDSGLQMSCRHELRIVIPEAFRKWSGISRDEIMHGDAVFHLTKKFVPEGVRMEVVEREILHPYVFNGKEVTLAIFLLNYSGESVPLTRNTADRIRSELEMSVNQQWGFDIAKGGRLVSRPYPSHLLPSLIREKYERKKTKISK